MSTDTTLALRVASVEALTPHVKTFRLVAADGSPLPGYVGVLRGGPGDIGSSHRVLSDDGTTGSAAWRSRRSNRATARGSLRSTALTTGAIWLVSSTGWSGAGFSIQAVHLG